MAITTEAGLITALATPYNANFSFASITGGTGQFITPFRSWITPPGAAANPSASGAALDRTATGALPIPPAVNTTYLSGAAYTQLAPNASQFGIFYDRLVETGGLDSTVTTSQTVNSAALPARNTTGANTELYLEIYAALGGTGTTVTVTYTNQAATGSRTGTVALPANARINTSWPVTLQAGDTGIQSVQSCSLTPSTGTAGNFGFVIRQPIGVIVHIPYNPGSATLTFGSGQYGWSETGLAKIPDNACLELLLYGGVAAASNAVFGWIQTIQG